MFLIRVKDDFCGAHSLNMQDGTVEPLHGHNWKVEVVVACPQLDDAGMGIDFLDVHGKLHNILDSELDHRNLNDIDELSAPNPTSERIAAWIADKLAPQLSDDKTGVTLKSVTVWETDEFGVTYEPGGRLAPA